MARWSTQPVT